MRICRIGNLSNWELRIGIFSNWELRIGNLLNWELRIGNLSNWDGLGENILIYKDLNILVLTTINAVKKKKKKKGFIFRCNI